MVGNGSAGTGVFEPAIFAGPTLMLPSVDVNLYAEPANEVHAMSNSAVVSPGKAVTKTDSIRRVAKLALKSGQNARTESLREARTARVKAAFAVAGAANTLFRAK